MDDTRYKENASDGALLGACWFRNRKTAGGDRKLKADEVSALGGDMFRAAKPRAVVYTGPWEGKAAAYSNN